MEEPVRPMFWRNDALQLLDQRRLPEQAHYLSLRSAPEVAQAIRDMAVRGAPAIGIAAAYGMALAATGATTARKPTRATMRAAFDLLSAARPTAVNLIWALQRMAALVERIGVDGPALLQEACRMHAEDIDKNRCMGACGAGWLPRGARLLTHCNTGALATGGFGTALGVVRMAHERGRLGHVFVDETRPWLQGARLTAWELAREGIAGSLIADAAAPWMMQQGKIDWVVVGADRIAANGDVANKIGTYALAVAARHHQVRFMVVAPMASVDLRTADGSGITIEERPARELTHWRDQALAPPGFAAVNPVFDITPAALVDVLVTEAGALERPDGDKMGRLLASASQRQSA